MGEPAKKLPEQPKNPEMSPLEPGDRLLMGVCFPNRSQINSTSVMLGRSYDWGFDLSGPASRIVAKANGTILVSIRQGARVEGGQTVGGRYRDVIFYANGMFGAVPAND